MFSRFFLPTLLSAFLLSSLLKASLPQVAQAGENPQEEAGPMMMLDPHQKGPPDTIHSNSNQGEIGKRVGSEQNDDKQSCNETTSNFFAEDDSSRAALSDGSLLADPKKDAMDVTPKSGLDPVLVCLDNNYSRSYFITQKKSAYEQELLSLNEGSERANLLNALILLLDQAHTYQAQMLKHLEAQAEKKISQALKNSYFLHGMMEINKGPNKVELLIEEIEKDYQELMRSQKTSEEIENKITALISETPPAPIPPLLINAQQVIRESLDHYRALIPLKLDSANLIQLPFEKKIDEATQAAIEASRINIIKTAALAQQRYLLAKNNFYKTTFPWSAMTNPSIPANDLNSAAISLHNVFDEAQRDQPRQEVMDYFLRSAELFQQAVAALGDQNDPNRVNRATSLSNAGGSLFKAALEAKRLAPRQNVIDRYLESAEFYQKPGSKN
jgi:hypothetical protein